MCISRFPGAAAFWHTGVLHEIERLFHDTASQQLLFSAFSSPITFCPEYCSMSRHAVVRYRLIAINYQPYARRRLCLSCPSTVAHLPRPGDQYTLLDKLLETLLDRPANREACRKQRYQSTKSLRVPFKPELSIKVRVPSTSAMFTAYQVSNTQVTEPHPLAICGCKQIIVEVIDNVVNPTRCRQHLNSVRLMVCYIDQCLHMAFFACIVQVGGRGSPLTMYVPTKPLKLGA